MTQVWINGGDIILVGLRDYQDGKADVILKYSPDEARNLKAYGELPESGKILIICDPFIIPELPIRHCTVQQLR